VTKETTEDISLKLEDITVHVQRPSKNLAKMKTDLRRRMVEQREECWELLEQKASVVKV
jgi:hypothetical protein